MRAAGIRRRGGLVRAAAVLMSAGIVLGVLGMAGQEDSAGREHGAGREYRAGWEGTAKLGDGGPGEILGRAFRAGGTWIAESLWNQQGYFFMEKAGREADRRGWERWKDPDPSYRNYQAVQRFYEEHAYLAWYGGEETGTDREENGAGAGPRPAGNGRKRKLRRLTDPCGKPEPAHFRAYICAGAADGL